MVARSFDTADRGVQAVRRVAGSRLCTAEHDMRYRLDVVASSVVDVVRFAGGWLFDRAMAGWDVTVLIADRPDDRPLQVLGAQTLDLEYALTTVTGLPRKVWRRPQTYSDATHGSGKECCRPSTMASPRSLFGGRPGRLSSTRASVWCTISSALPRRSSRPRLWRRPQCQRPRSDPPKHFAAELWRARRSPPTLPRRANRRSDAHPNPSIGVTLTPTGPV